MARDFTHYPPTTDVCDNAHTKSDAVVQVRLGDALCGTNKDMLQKRPPAPQQLADVVKGKVSPGAFVKVMAMPENHPLNQCKQETRDYLDALTTNLPAHHVSFSEVGTLTPQEAADFDLCEMVRAPACNIVREHESASSRGAAFAQAPRRLRAQMRGPMSPQKGSAWL